VKLIVGLGNPGIEYQFTPHNAGFLAIDRIARVCGVTMANRRGRAVTATTRLAGEEVMLAKPETFMNLSGLSVAALMKELGMESTSELIVLYDDLALPLGSLRVRERGSAGGHNGVSSISSVLGTQEWLRIRIGVGREPVDGREIRMGGKDFLLSPMKKAEMLEIDLVLDRVMQAVETVIKMGPAAAMNEFNRKDDREV
jgi:PTH1 family peptidyl-tRNA hydrolase